MHASYSIAVVEDDLNLQQDLVEYLQMTGFQAEGFSCAEDFFLAWPETSYTLLILDIILTDKSGLDIAMCVRQSNPNIGIIILSALDSNAYQVSGLNAGADMHLSKHCSLDVIYAACQSLIRRLDNNKSNAQTWHLCLQSWALKSPLGDCFSLTHSEALLLQALFQVPHTVISREDLLKTMNKPDTLSNLRNLDNTASRLRRKIQAGYHGDFPLRPSYGRGYAFLGQCKLAR